MIALLEQEEEVRGLDELPTDALYEVIDGEAKEVAAMSAGAGIVANELAFRIQQARRTWRDIVVTEVLFELPAPVNRRRRPDVAFLPEERARGAWPPPNRDASSAIAAVPTLAVEVISPNDLIVEVEEKRIEYFAVGVVTVLVVHPKCRTIHVYRSASSCQILTEADSLELGEILPGFSVRVADLFAPLNPPS